MGAEVWVAALGVLGLVGAAGVTGWFSYKAQRQKDVAVVTTAEVRTLGTEVSDALALLRSAMDDAKAKDAEIRRLTLALDDCRRSHHHAP